MRSIRPVQTPRRLALEMPPNDIEKRRGVIAGMRQLLRLSELLRTADRRKIAPILGALPPRSVCSRPPKRKSRPTDIFSPGWHRERARSIVSVTRRNLDVVMPRAWLALACRTMLQIRLHMLGCAPEPDHAEAATS